MGRTGPVRARLRIVDDGAVEIDLRGELDAAAAGHLVQLAPVVLAAAPNQVQLDLGHLVVADEGAGRRALRSFEQTLVDAGVRITRVA